MATNQELRNGIIALKTNIKVKVYLRMIANIFGYISPDNIIFVSEHLGVSITECKRIKQGLIEEMAFEIDLLSVLREYKESVSLKRSYAVEVVCKNVNNVIFGTAQVFANTKDEAVELTNELIGTGQMTIQDIIWQDPFINPEHFATTGDLV